jgi:hypothetical protein
MLGHNHRMSTSVRAPRGVDFDETPSPQVVALPPEEAALDDSGYSIHGNGSDSIELSIASPQAISGRITRLSPTVAWVLPSLPLEPSVWQQTSEVYLKSNGAVIGPLRAQTLGTEAPTKGASVGIQLVDVSVEQGRQILAMLQEALRRGVAEPAASVLPVQEEIVDRERIRAVLSGIAAVGNKGVLRRLGRTIRIAIEQCDAESGELHWRTDDAGLDWGEGPYEIDVIGYNSAYRMRLESATAQGGRMVTPVPAQLWRIRHRWHRRVPTPPEVRIRFQHPLWRELPTIECDAVDISLGGLCIRTAPDDLLFPGLLLPEVALDTGLGEHIRLRGEVRYVASRGGAQPVCGLNVVPLPGEEPKWVRFVSQVLCPTTRTSENLIEPLWELFVLSGYFNLAGKTAEDFDVLKANFMAVGKRAAQVPQLFCQTVWPSERGIEATLSFAKAYRHTWLLHQLAKRPGKPPAVAHAPGQILRDIYLRTFEHSQSDPDYKWALSYAESNTPFVEKSHLRYARRMANTGNALCMPVRMMHANVNEFSAVSAKGLEFDHATPEEKALLAAEIARTRPTCYIEALDLTPERLEMTAIASTWQNLGLQRKREIFVARRQGRPLAALILEVGQPGTNLFRLMDAARLFPLAPDGKSAYIPLLDEARRWYARHDVDTFIYLREDGDDSYAEAGHLHDSDEAAPYLWIISSKLVPDFLEYVSEMTVGRMPRSRQTG